MRKCLELLKCPRGLVNYLAPPSYEDIKIAVIKGDI
jgi:ankyrin repeat protein